MRALLLVALAFVGCDDGGADTADPDEVPSLDEIPRSGFGVPVAPSPFEPGVPGADLYEGEGGAGGVGGDGGAGGEALLERACPEVVMPRSCDGDGDGRGEGCALPVDCDDADPTVFPGAPDLPGDGVDQDCDGADGDLIEEGGVFVLAGAADDAAGSRAEPVGTVARGIALAVERGLPAVFVAAGAYPEGVETPVSVYGGFEPAGWARDPAAHRTEIDAIDVRGAPIAIDGLVVHGRVDVAAPEPAPDCTAERCPAVVLSGNEINIDRAEPHGVIVGWGHTVLAGNTIFAGEFDGPGFPANGVLASTTSGTLLVIDNDITMAYAGLGAGVSLRDGDARVLGNRVEGRMVGVGVGASAPCGAWALVADNAITAPVGVEVVAALAHVTRNRIRGTDAAEAIGVDCDGGDLLTTNNTISLPAGGERRLGLRSAQGASATIAHNTVVVGGAERRSVGLDLGDSLSARVLSNIIDADAAAEAAVIVAEGPLEVRGNLLDPDPAICLLEAQECVSTLSLLNACDWAGCAAADGNASVDAGLVDPGGGDLHLGPDSPAIDAAVDPSRFEVELNQDVDGEPRPAGGGYDIGADEVP